jgi:hypothetical protein
MKESVQLKNTGRQSQGAWRQDDLIVGRQLREVNHKKSNKYTTKKFAGKARRSYH